MLTEGRGRNRVGIGGAPWGQCTGGTGKTKLEAEHKVVWHGTVNRDTLQMTILK